MASKMVAGRLLDRQMYCILNDFCIGRAKEPASYVTYLRYIHTYVVSPELDPL